MRNRPGLGIFVCVGALLLCVEQTVFPGPTAPVSRGTLSGQTGSQPQIDSVTILEKGQPVEYITAGTKTHQYKIQVEGQGFDSSSRIFLNGKKTPTRVESATELSAKLIGIDLIPGELSLQVSNSDGSKSGVVIIDVVSQPSVLSIGSFSPNVGQVGASVTISGIGFTQTGNKLRFVKVADPSLRGITADFASSGNTSFTFEVPDSVCVGCPTPQVCPPLCFQLDPAEYLVAVENANGLSNSLSFLVSSVSGPIGFWGGNGTAVIVTDTQVQAEGDCFSGLVPRTMTTDSGGDFSLSGTYQVLAGPVRQGQQGTPAQFSGSIVGNTMTMTITVNSGSPFTIGPFPYTFGDYEVIVHPCL